LGLFRGHDDRLATLGLERMSALRRISKRAHTARCVASLGALLAATAVVVPGLGVRSAAGEEPIVFRRVMAPHDRVADWPVDAIPYVPVDPMEFETLVEQAAFAGTGVPTQRGAELAKATYFARYKDGELTAGTASLTI